MLTVDADMPASDVGRPGTTSPAAPPGRVHWPRVLAEGVAIVVSILLAFALNAWWEADRARDDEAAILQGLWVDFETTLGSLAQALAAQQTRVAVADTILQLTGPSPTRVTEDRAEDLLARLVNGAVPFRPVQGTLEALFASQGLGSISSPALRSALAAWPQHMARVEQVRQVQVGFMNTRLLPYLGTFLPVRTLDARSSGARLSLRSRFPMSATVVFMNLEFENMVNDYYFYHGSMIRDMAAAKMAADSILDLVGRELERSK
jgi:hypothetical protein